MDDKVTILFLAANPKDTERLRLDEEVREVSDALVRAKKRERLDLLSKWAVRIQDLRRTLQDLGDVPIIVHFAGHGGDGGIYFEDRDGHATRIEAQALRSFFGNFPTIQCVVLNACFSSEVAESLVDVVPCVIGLGASVPDKYAIDFSVAFYDGIGAGYTPVRAFNVARSSLGLDNTLDLVRPELRTKSGAEFQSLDFKTTHNLEPAWHATQRNFEPAIHAEPVSIRGLSIGSTKFTDARRIIGSNGRVRYETRDEVTYTCLTDSDQGLHLEFLVNDDEETVLHRIVVSRPFNGELPHGLHFGMLKNEAVSRLNTRYRVEDFDGGVEFLCEPMAPNQGHFIAVLCPNNRVERVELSEF